MGRLSTQLDRLEHARDESTHTRSPQQSMRVAAERTMVSEAVKNEVRLGLVRVAAYGLVLLLDLALLATAARPPEQILGSGVAVAIAFALLLAVYKLPAFWFLRFVVPVVDALLILGMLRWRLGLLGPGADLNATAAASAALFAATGSIRFDRLSAAWTTALAAGLMWALLFGRMAPVALTYSTCAIVAVGLLNVWVTDLVRRSVEARRSRAVLERFLPAEVVEKSFGDASQILEPRSVEATVMVTDLRGFTSLAEGMAPDDVLSTLSELQGALAVAVQKAGGTVDKFMGDGMLAVFGAVTPLPDHAARALQAARSIRFEVKRLNFLHPNRPPLKVGAGIHSGTLVAGCIGSAHRLEFTIVGDTVNTASRLESLTKEKQTDILVSEETVRRAGAQEDLRALGSVQIRGKAQPLSIYALD